MVKGLEAAGVLLFFLQGGAAARAMTGLTGPRPGGRRVLMSLPVKGGLRLRIGESVKSKWWGKTKQVMKNLAWRHRWRSRSRRLDYP